MMHLCTSLCKDSQKKRDFVSRCKDKLLGGQNSSTPNINNLKDVVKLAL